ncbi:hypothetical protein ACFXKR_07820 [Streptomyces violascens]|uniref:hypothetical protein n=1 Tax=Streptomyces violascens TaxID=67381 RepID=UPI00367B3560
MTSTSVVRHRVAPLVTAASALTVSVYTDARLLGYGVPTLLAMACAVSIGLGIANLVKWAFSLADLNVYRCPAVGCTFTAHLTRASAAERRRWQEIAAAHPDHESTYRR